MPDYPREMYGDQEPKEPLDAGTEYSRALDCADLLMQMLLALPNKNDHITSTIVKLEKLIEVLDDMG